MNAHIKFSNPSFEQRTQLLSKLLLNVLEAVHGLYFITPLV
jgi:hypothetical protein